MSHLQGRVLRQAQAKEAGASYWEIVVGILVCETRRRDQLETHREITGSGGETRPARAEVDELGAFVSRHGFQCLPEVFDMTTGEKKRKNKQVSK